MVSCAINPETNDLTTVVGLQKFEISWIEELSRMFPFQFL